MKKILVLGGKPIGSIDLVLKAKEMGYYVVVTDYLASMSSPAKQYADEAWDISTSEVDLLEQKCIEHKIDGILTAVHEFNINRMLDLCERLNLPCYCKRSTWLYCDNKAEFKALCKKNNINVAMKYEISTDDGLYPNISFPVICKPNDGSGSRGFSICNNPEELKKGYLHALDFSPSGQVICEDYIPYDTVIIHYTMVNGKCFYSGMSDKISVKFSNTGASVMGFQSFPSKGEDVYLRKVNTNVIRMFENANFTDGPIWIEAFYDGKDCFIFNEMGYRFGGSMTNYPVHYFYDIDQLELIIKIAMGETVTLCNPCKKKIGKKYCIIPIHIKEGTIKTISGKEFLNQEPGFLHLIPVHFQGDIIKDWGSAQQVFAYLHLSYSSNIELKASILNVLNIIKVRNEYGENMLYTLFDLDRLN